MMDESQLDETRFEDAKPDEIDADELRRGVEWMCWMALAMAPLIYWLQGPSVSRDQFVVRTGLVVLAAAGAAGFRGMALLRWYRRRGVAKR